MVARDDLGGILNAWALDQLTMAEHFQRIIVEGDAIILIRILSFGFIKKQMEWQMPLQNLLLLSFILFVVIKIFPSLGL